MNLVRGGHFAPSLELKLFVLIETRSHGHTAVFGTRPCLLHRIGVLSELPSLFAVSGRLRLAV